MAANAQMSERGSDLKKKGHFKEDRENSQPTRTGRFERGGPRFQDHDDGKPGKTQRGKVGRSSAKWEQQQDRYQMVFPARARSLRPAVV